MSRRIPRAKAHRASCPGVIEPQQRRGVLRATAVLQVFLTLAACRGPIEEADVWCTGVPAPAIDPPALDLEAPGVSRRNLLAWVELLSAPDLRGRHAGDPGADVVAGLLAAQMNRLGLAPARSGGGHEVPVNLAVLWLRFGADGLPERSR